MPWRGDPQFAVRVANTPRRTGASPLTAARARIHRPNDSRLLLAVERRRQGWLTRADVQIGDWSRPWNSKSDRRSVTHHQHHCGPPRRVVSIRSDASTPPRDSSTTGTASFSGRISCGATASSKLFALQIGTPISETQRRSAISEFNRLVRNIYKVLLTRGMVGTVIYSTDEETRKALHALVSENS